MKKQEEWLKHNRGDEAEERFDGLLGALTNLFNAFVIVGSAFAALGGLGPGPKKENHLVNQEHQVNLELNQQQNLLAGKPGMKPTGPRGAKGNAEKAWSCCKRYL